MPIVHFFNVYSSLMFPNKQRKLSIYPVIKNLIFFAVLFYFSIIPYDKLVFMFCITTTPHCRAHLIIFAVPTG